MDALSLADNLQRASFRRPPSRDVISPHSHSVLADPEPELSLDVDLAERISQLFVTSAEAVAAKPVKSEKKPAVEEHTHYTDSLPRSDMVAALLRLGFESARDRVFEVEALMERYAGERSSFTRHRLDDSIPCSG